MTTTPPPEPTPLILQTLKDRGMDPSALANARAAAQRLCAQCGTLEGGGLAPAGPLDYHALLQRLADEAG